MFAVFVILAWIPVAAGLFAIFPPVRALVLTYLVGWLVLPMIEIPIRGFWDIDKILATNIGAVAGALLFCPMRFKRYRVGLGDVALFVFLAGAAATSLSNGLGAYDAFSSFTHKVFYFAVPFWMGRAFIRDQKDLLDACRLIVYGAALCALAAVWEWRMSPKIHLTIYGIFQHGWQLSHRWGFWRPIVCFPSTLALGTFFAWTALLGIWLYRIGKLPPIKGVPALLCVGLTIMGLLASMSLGPWSLFLGGLALLWVWKRTRRGYIVLLPAAFAVLWIVGRTTGVTDGKWLSSLAREISEDRAGSLQYRIDAETLLVERAKERFLFGWGGYGRNHVQDERGRNLVATDGLWIIFLGTLGVVGLASFYLWWCSPLLMCVRNRRGTDWSTPVGVLTIIVGMEAVDFLFNAFLSPILTLMSGGLVTALAAAPQISRAALPVPRVPFLPSVGRAGGAI